LNTPGARLRTATGVGNRLLNTLPKSWLKAAIGIGNRLLIVASRLAKLASNKEANAKTIYLTIK
jgi:hypothetical protein